MLWHPQLGRLEAELVSDGNISVSNLHTDKSTGTTSTRATCLGR